MALWTSTTDTLNKRRVLEKNAVRQPDHINESPPLKLKRVLVELGMLDHTKHDTLKPYFFKRENGKGQIMTNKLLRAEQFSNNSVSKCQCLIVKTFSFYSSL